MAYRGKMRVGIHLDQKYQERIEFMANEMGVKKAVLIRIAINEYHKQMFGDSIKKS